MSDEKVSTALRELRYLTECRCAPPWTERGLHETHCASDYREDVEALAEAMTALYEHVRRNKIEESAT